MVNAPSADPGWIGTALPRLTTPVPGPASRAQLERLEAAECPASTARRDARAARGGVPGIVWASARGANVVDVDGNVYVDLCGGYGVAAVGYRHPAVVDAGTAQLQRLPNAMGEAFADATRIDLMEALTRRCGLPRVMFGSSGSDALEIAVKSARLATGRTEVVTFDGAYHGLSAGTLPLLGYEVELRQAPFRDLLGPSARRAAYGGPLPDLREVAAVVVEPVQGRGGMRAPPPGWLAALHAEARAAGALVVHDEVYSGLGRTGMFLAAEAERDPHGRPLRPDLLCLGKSLGGGFPIAACLGTEAAMAGWSAHPGALPTQTFQGSPLGCAMALATLDVLEMEQLPARAALVGADWAAELARVPGVRGVTGRGLMLGVAVDDAPGVTARMLRRGWIVLPCGEGGRAIGLTPPLTITTQQLRGAVAALAGCV